MMEIPKHVALFINECIHSFEQLEMLILLRTHPERIWTAEDVSRALSTHPNSAAARLTQFHDRGILLAEIRPDGPRYRYQPQRPDLERTITELANFYSRYPIRVINAIFSKRIGGMRACGFLLAILTYSEPYM